MAKRIVLGKVPYGQITVTVSLDQPQKAGRERIYVHVQQKGKGWQNSFVRVSKFQGLLRFESEKKKMNLGQIPSN